MMNNQIEVKGAKITTWDLARAMSDEQMAGLLDDWVNGKSGASGGRIGKELATTHPSLQANAVHFVAGILRGLVENVKHTDPRNEWQIALARKMLEAYNR